MEWAADFPAAAVSTILDVSDWNRLIVDDEHSLLPFERVLLSFRLENIVASGTTNNDEFAKIESNGRSCRASRRQPKWFVGVDKENSKPTRIEWRDVTNKRFLCYFSPTGIATKKRWRKTKFLFPVRRQRSYVTNLCTAHKSGRQNSFRSLLIRRSHRNGSCSPAQRRSWILIDNNRARLEANTTNDPEKASSSWHSEWRNIRANYHRIVAIDREILRIHRRQVVWKTMSNIWWGKMCSSLSLLGSNRIEVKNIRHSTRESSFRIRNDTAGIEEKDVARSFFSLEKVDEKRTSWYLQLIQLFDRSLLSYRWANICWKREREKKTVDLNCKLECEEKARHRTQRRKRRNTRAIDEWNLSTTMTRRSFQRQELPEVKKNDDEVSSVFH